jgi:hypothetical protein
MKFLILLMLLGSSSVMAQSHLSPKSLGSEDSEFVDGSGFMLPSGATVHVFCDKGGDTLKFKETRRLADRKEVEISCIPTKKMKK